MKFNARYNLRKQNSKKPEKIYLICRIWVDKYVYPTPFNVLPEHWNNERQRVRNVIAEPNRDLINNFLEDLRKESERLYSLHTAQRQPLTKKAFRDKLDLWTGKVKEEKITFWGWTKKYIADSTGRINPRTGRNISNRTILEYKTTFKYLSEFEKTLSKNEKLDFENIAIHTLKDFRDFLTTKKRFSVNNIAKHIENFRQFLRAASENKIQIDKDVINPKKFRVAKEETVNIYMTESELKKMYNLNLSKAESHQFTNAKTKKRVTVNYSTLDKVRDLFLIGCFTGMRVSDYTNIQPHNIKENYKYLSFYQKKTGNEVAIPIDIFPSLKPILKKYNGQPPKVSQQKINLYIKEIARLAGIVENIEIQRTEGGIKTVKIYPKCQLVTTHAGRRSFASNLIKKGVPGNLVREMTGHKKEDVFRKYNKLSAMEKAAAVVNSINEKKDILK